MSPTDSREAPRHHHCLFSPNAAFETNETNFVAFLKHPYSKRMLGFGLAAMKHGGFLVNWIYLAEENICL